MDITKEFEANKDTWLTEVKLQNLLRTAFPEQRFWVELNEENDSITIKDCFKQKIIARGPRENPIIELDAESNSHVLKQAVTYLLAMLEQSRKTPADVLAAALFGGKNHD